MKISLKLGTTVLLALSLVAGHAESNEWLEKKIFTDAEGNMLPYRLLSPINSDPKEKYPLVILLHGAGSRGQDNQKQLVHGVPEFLKPENRNAYPCFLIAPQCPADQYWVDYTASGKSFALAKEPSKAMRLVLGLIDQIQKDYPIDPKRIYVTGLSMGGAGTWDLLGRRPDLFAAGVPICGAANEATVPAIVKIPIWNFHGADDHTVPVIYSRQIIAALKQAGGDPKYTEYPNTGHDSWTQAYKDKELMKWLFAQKRE